MTIDCTLCFGKTLTSISFENDVREYYHCERCKLIFVDPRFHLSKENERNRYLLHNNGIEHTGYVLFLNRIIQPCLQFLEVEMIGLDYGCGPAPTLSKILAQHGIKCFDYDPIFGIQHPNETYDFIFATECFEHFFYPRIDLPKLNSLLKPGGLLAVMTEQWKNVEQIGTWHYKKDPTHVSFFHRNTFDYLCEQFKYSIEHTDHSRIIILRKS